MVYGKDFDSSKEARPQQGGRFASASDNIKNKANTARLQGEETFQVIDSKGDTIEYNAAQYKQYQEQQKRQQEVQRQQEIQRNNRQKQSGYYPGISDYEGIPRNVQSGRQPRSSGYYPGISDYEGIPKNVQSGPPTQVSINSQKSPPRQKFILFKNDKRSAREQMAAQSGYDVSPKTTKQQGPNLKEDVFFVGSNAQGFTIESQKQIEPRVTSSDLFGSNQFTRRLDKIYELNKPVSERSDKPRVGDPIGFSNREIGELTAWGFNRATEIKDLVTKEKGLTKPLGSPFAKFEVKNPSPKIETTFDKIVSGKPVDWSDKNTRFSAYGSVLGFAGELYTFNKGIGGSFKVAQSIEKTIQVSKVGKAAKLTNEGKEFGITKFDDSTFLIAKGTEGRNANVPMDISPTVLFGKVKEKYLPFLSKTPKEVNTLSSGEKIQASIAKIDKDIAKLKPFTNKSRFNSKLIEKTNQKIKELEGKRSKFQNELANSILPGPAQNPISIIEFGRKSAQFPKGEIFTEFGKSIQMKDTPIGTKIIIQGEVPSSTLKEFGLKELPSFVSKEFGIETKARPLYSGIVTQESASKLIEAERLGFIKTIATGKSAPLEAILKRQSEILRGYSGAKTAITKTAKSPIPETMFSWKSFSRKSSMQSEIEPILTQSINAPNMGFSAAESFGIVNNKVLPRGVTGYGSKGLKNIKLPKPESISFESGFIKSSKKFRPFDYSSMKSEKGIGGSTGKAASITLKDASKAAENYLSTRSTSAKSEIDILFSAPRFLPITYHGSMSEDILGFPPGTSQKITGSGDWFRTNKTKSKSKSKFQDEISIMLTPKQPSNQKQNLNVIPGFSFSGDLKTILTPRTTPFEDLITTPITTPRTTPKQTPRIIPRTTPITIPITTPITTPIPVPRTTPEIIPKPPRFGFSPYFPSAFFGSGGYETPASLKKAFAAYGISSDINIKTLPTYSRYSSGTNIFKEQSKEDTRIQNLFYGKPKRKSKTKKKSRKR